MSNTLRNGARARPRQHRIGVPPRSVGEDELAAVQGGDGFAQRRVRLERRMIDLMHEIEKSPGCMPCSVISPRIEVP